MSEARLHWLSEQELHRHVSGMAAAGFTFPPEVALHTFYADILAAKLGILVNR